MNLYPLHFFIVFNIKLMQDVRYSPACANPAQSGSGRAPLDPDPSVDPVSGAMH